MPQTPCSFTYFPSGNAAALRTNTNVTKFTNKGGGGYIFNWNMQRPFIPIAGLAADLAGDFVLLPVAQNIAGMPTIIMQWFQAALNASFNYSTDVVAPADEIVFGADNYFASYLFKRVYPDGFQTARYLYVANAIKQFWLGADPAWTTAQYFAAVQNFKEQLSNGLADPNLFIAPADYNFNAASAFAVALTAFKTASPTLVAFDNIELILP